MKKFLFSNCIKIQDVLFAVGIFAGLPAQIDLSDGRVTYCDMMKGLISREKATVIDCLDCFENKVYALDSGEDNLIIWDMAALQCRYIPLGCRRPSWIHFIALERYRSDYYIFPKYENKIWVFHTDKNEITEIRGYLDHFREAQCACRVDNNVWILPKDADVLYCYDLSEGTKNRYDLNTVVRECVDAVFYDGCIYILNMFGIIYQWNIEKKELQEITATETVHDKKMSVGRIVYAGNKLILLPAYGSDITILDLQTEKAEIYQDYPDDYDDRTEWLKYYGYCEDETYCYFAACAANYLLKIDKRSGALLWMKPKTDSLGGKTIDSLAKKVVYESNWELTDLFEITPMDPCYSAGMNIGKEIYDRVGRTG